MTQQAYSDIANILEGCVKGEKSLEASLECIWPYEIYKDDFINEVLHFFRHYYDDTDIRSKDLEYSQKQNQQLLEYIAILKKKFQEKSSHPDLKF